MWLPDSTVFGAQECLSCIQPEAGVEAALAGWHAGGWGTPTIFSRAQAALSTVEEVAAEEVGDLGSELDPEDLDSVLIDVSHFYLQAVYTQARLVFAQDGSSSCWTNTVKLVVCALAADCDLHAVTCSSQMSNVHCIECCRQEALMQSFWSICRG